MRFDPQEPTVYLDGSGAFVKPDPPPADAPPSVFTAWLRDLHAFRDRLGSSAALAFDKRFRASIKHERP